MKTSHQRRKASPQYKQAKRRSLLQKTRILFVVLGVLCLLIAALLGGIWVIRTPTYAEWLGKLTVAYFLAGLFFLLVRAMLSKKRTSWRSRLNTGPASAESGMTLVLILVLLSLISALILHAQHAARLARRSAEKELALTRLELAVQDEVFYVLQKLADDPDQRVDHLGKFWSSLHESERPDGIGVAIQIEDLNRRFDLNNIRPGDAFAYADHSERMIMDLLTRCGDYDSLERVEALRDWVDPDEEGRREGAFYRTRDPFFRVPGTWLQGWGELLHIEGFSPAYFDRMDKPDAAFGVQDAAWMDVFTMIPGPRAGVTPVNINTASQTVLEGMLGMEREPLIRYILLTRADRPFRSIDGLLAAADPALIRDFRPYLDVRSSHFEVRARASDPLRHALEVRAWIHRDPQGVVRILRWMPLAGEAS